MDTEQQGHITVRKGLSFPPVEACTSCCPPGLYHCPFCSPAFFKPATRAKVMFHLESHFRRAHFIGEYTIHKCGLECLKKPHYHCLYCLLPMRSQQDFSKHFSVCHARQKLMVQEQQEAMATGDETNESTVGESMDSSFTMESEIEENRQLESCSQTASHAASLPSKPSEARSVRIHPQPSASKCDKMIQTNIEKPQDCDEFYFMSLVKLFKKLSPNKKAEVRMQMERILFEAEFK